MRKRDKLKRWGSLGLGICLMTLSGCAASGVGRPAHCITKDETFRYTYIVAEKMAIFKPTTEGVPTQYTAFANRVDYLEGMCVGVNAYRGE